MFNCDAGTSKGFFDSVVGSEFATRPATPTKVAPKPASSKPASAGFFDSAVGSEFGVRSETPTKAAPKQAAPKQAVPKQAAPKQAALKQAAPKQAAPTTAASGMFPGVLLSRAVLLPKAYSNITHGSCIAAVHL